MAGDKEEGAYTRKPSQVPQRWTPEDCFQKAAEKLVELDDEVRAIKGGYEARDLAAEWRRLGVAIRGDAPKPEL